MRLNGVQAGDLVEVEGKIERVIGREGRRLVVVPVGSMNPAFRRRVTGQRVTEVYRRRRPRE